MYNTYNGTAQLHEQEDRCSKEDTVKYKEYRQSRYEKII